jgi:hypothetical protein
MPCAHTASMLSRPATPLNQSNRTTLVHVCCSKGGEETVITVESIARQHYLWTYKCVSIRMYVCMYVCMSVCMCADLKIDFDRAAQVNTQGPGWPMKPRRGGARRSCNCWTGSCDARVLESSPFSLVQIATLWISTTRLWLVQGGEVVCEDGRWAGELVYIQKH